MVKTICSYFVYPPVLRLHFCARHSWIHAQNTLRALRRCAARRISTSSLSESCCHVPSDSSSLNCDSQNCFCRPLAGKRKGTHNVATKLYLLQTSISPWLHHARFIFPTLKYRIRMSVMKYNQWHRVHV